MKNSATTQPSPFALLIKSIGVVINSFFQSGSNREFRRLKDFIAS
ncbi:hypothetical protein [Ferruginibacter sp.]